jgi:hypothetical protein
MAKAAAHESFERDEVRVGSDRSFGVVFFVVFALIAFWPFFWGGEIRVWALAIAVVFLAAALIRPRILHPLNRLWFKFGIVLHHVVNPLVMGLIFFVGLLPTAIIMRLRGRDPLRLGRGRPSGTNWVERVPPGPPPDTMKHLF